MTFTKVSILTVLVALVAVVAMPAHGQQAKVLKVQGKKAIVQFPEDVKPRVGQLIEVGSGPSEGSMTAGNGTGSREMIIGGSAEFSSLTTSSSSASTSALGLTGRYGLNKVEMEYGGLGTFSYASTTGTSSRTIGFGGFFDYNLVPNTPGTEMVYGAGGEVVYSMISTTTGSAESSATTLRFQGGGQMKWFPFGNTVAVRGDLVYRFQQNGGTTSSTTSGLVALGGLYVYF